MCFIRGMKKLILLYSLILSFVSEAQSTKCILIELLDLSYSNSTGEFRVSVYNGNATLNYPGVAFTLDASGDTLQKSANNWAFYTHPQFDTVYYNTAIHHYPNTINPSFPLSVYFTFDDGVSGYDTCILTYSHNSTFIEQSVEDNMSIYPNPSKGFFSVKIDQECIGSSYQVLNNFGLLIEKGIIKELSQDFNLSDKPKGVYRIQVLNDKTLKTVNVVIQ